MNDTALLKSIRALSDKEVLNIINTRCPHSDEHKFCSYAAIRPEGLRGFIEYVCSVCAERTRYVEAVALITIYPKTPLPAIPFYRMWRLATIPELRDIIRACDNYEPRGDGNGGPSRDDVANEFALRGARWALRHSMIKGDGAYIVQDEEGIYFAVRN